MERLHYLQHVAFEDIANVGVWAEAQGWTLSRTRLHEGEIFPKIDSLDWLVIMGGPMNIYEYEAYPWLVEEKRFIRECIDAGKVVMGICLGAQLIADVLGGGVTQNEHTEIGWFPVTLTEEGKQDSLLSGLPESFESFHWHGDTFAIPPGAKHLASSEACVNQAFQFGDRVLGMQFHLDYSVQSIKTMVKHCGDELVEGAYIQPDPSILVQDHKAQGLKRLLGGILARLTSVQSGV